MYLFVLLLILSILYFIFGWKHDLSGKYKHESCFIKIGLYSNYANPIRKVSLSILPTTFRTTKKKKKKYIFNKRSKRNQN